MAEIYSVQAAYHRPRPRFEFGQSESCGSDSFATKRNLVEIIRFTLFSRHVVFDGEGDKLRNKRIENHITVSVVIDMECGNTKN